jgi:hypothetical protein
MPKMINMDEVRSRLEKLAKFRHPTALLLAVDRLGRSRISFRPVDRIIDLGMALEIALMHGEGDGKSEITTKIAARAGWLGGNSVGERRANGEIAKKIYAARSTAVHEGQLSTKALAKLGELRSIDDFITGILNTILTRESFPDWVDLTFGG